VEQERMSAPNQAAIARSVACTCFKLRSLARRVTQLYDHEMAPSGLKVTQYSLLAHAMRGTVGVAPTVSELADAMFTDRTTLTRNLRPLVAAGFIEVAAGPDARSKGTVQADFWRFVQFNADSKLRNQKLFVVVTRNDFPWGEHLCNFEENYSLLVSLRDRENENAQLYTQIKAQLETKLRLRARV
jgi:hypothetical protein